ncbi:MAG TPA: TIGR03016 family PEP-CTERM system-associated outer membrane protein [Nitrosospira sp.]|nr:TIGR03016 family PEP-CTERM system-associated outer membrane protein [Nitrosospira sp.]
MKAPEIYCSRILSQAVCVALTTLFGVSTSSYGAEWSVRPRLDLIETYTDNIRLRSQGSGAGDFVTQINPGILLRGEGRRFNLQTDYRMNNLIYAETSSLTRIRHQLNARGTAELFEDFFFVDGRATITQQNASLFGPQAIDNVNVTGNRADIRTYSVSPYIRHRFKDFASGELRYAHNIVTSSSNLLRNSQADSFSATLNSGEDFTRLHWGLDYSNQMVHFDRTGRTIELERSIANLRYAVTPQFSLTATGGYERNSFISIRGDPSSPTWTAGFAWRPSERTDIAVSAGQRFFGDTYSALARHRTRLTVWNISYNENITTFNQQAFGSGLNFGGSLSQLLAAQNPNLSPDFIQQTSGALVGLGGTGAFFDPTNFFTNRLFLQKRLDASVAMNGSRNTIVLRGFNMTRQAYSPDIVDADLMGAANAALLRHTRQTGGNALWSYRISQLTRANLNLGYTRFSFLGTGREDDFKIVRVSLTRQFPQILRNLSGMIQYRHQERDSNQAGADYRENAAIASVNMTF